MGGLVRPQGMPRNGDAMIEVENLTKRYGRHTAVDGVSFKVQKGEILGFLGPNGAGKTTTMRILACYLPPTEGSARVAGFDVFDAPMEVKQRVGYLPETPPLYPDMDVETFLDFVAKIKAVAPKSRKARIDEAIEKCRIGDVRRTLIGRLSKGLSPACRPGPGHPPQPGRPDPRRAHGWPRPQADHRDARADPGAGGRAHHRPVDPHPARGLHDLRTRRHHQQGQSRGGRHAGEPDPPPEGRGGLAPRGARRDAGAVFDAIRVVPGVAAVRPGRPRAAAS